MLYFQISFRPIKSFIIITLDPVPYYIYLLNLKPVSYGIPYQKDFEKSRTLTLSKLNCPFIWLTVLWAKIYEHYESLLFYFCNMILCLYPWVYFYFLCNVCVFFFLFFTRWPACWAYACSGSLPLDLYMFNYCIILLFMLWRIKFSLSLSLHLSTNRARRRLINFVDRDQRATDRHWCCSCY